jgi:hypothetical protein
MLLPELLNALARLHGLAEFKGGFDANLLLMPRVESLKACFNGFDRCSL